jgi:hypothetical protein
MMASRLAAEDTAMRPNPGPFEPLIYLLQRPMSFRILGVGGLALFTVLALSRAAAHSAGALAAGLALLGAFWIESTANICRRCRFYGTWHCLGQGMLAGRLLPRIDQGASEPAVMLHASLAAAYVLYGLFWLWHSPLLGFGFTLWLPIAFISATTPAGFSWRARKPA